MDIALRKDLIDIQELIANPPGWNAGRARSERRRRRLRENGGLWHEPANNKGQCAGTNCGPGSPAPCDAEACRPDDSDDCCPEQRARQPAGNHQARCQCAATTHQQHPRARCRTASRPAGECECACDCHWASGGHSRRKRRSHHRSGHTHDHEHLHAGHSHHHHHNHHNDDHHHQRLAHAHRNQWAYQRLRVSSGSEERRSPAAKLRPAPADCEPGGCKYSSDNALNLGHSAAAGPAASRLRARGKTLTGGLASSELRALAHLRVCGAGPPAEERTQRAHASPKRPSSACALASPTPPHAREGRAAAIDACPPPDALLGDRPPKCAEEPPAPKRPSPSGSFRSHTSRRAGAPVQVGGASRLLVVWPQRSPLKRKGAAGSLQQLPAEGQVSAAAQQQQSQKQKQRHKQHNSIGARLSLLQLHNLMRRKSSAAAERKSESGSAPSWRDEEPEGAKDRLGTSAGQTAVDAEEQQPAGKTAAAGGRRMERHLKEEQGEPSVLLMRAPNGAKLLHTRPLAALDDTSQLYAIPRKSFSKVSRAALCCSRFLSRVCLPHLSLSLSSLSLPLSSLILSRLNWSFHDKSGRRRAFAAGLRVWSSFV